MFGLKLFKKNLLNLLPKVRGKYTPNVRLAKYTWFGVGGPAEVLYTPADAEDLSHFLKNKPSINCLMMNCSFSLSEYLSAINGI